MSDTPVGFGTWRIRVLRVTMFPPPGPQRNTEHLWKRVMGESAEAIDIRPKENLRTERGTVGSINLQLVVRPERIDWFLQPALIPSEQADPLPTIETFQEVQDILQKVVHGSSEVISPIDRLAFSPGLVEDAQDLAAVLNRLSSHLPGLDFTNHESADFIYQVNRRRRATSEPRLRINRIAKWSVLHVGNINLILRPGESTLINSTQTKFTAQLELDINTMPGVGAISAKKVPRLLNELIRLAGEIAVEGDIA